MSRGAERATGARPVVRRWFPAAVVGERMRGLRRAERFLEMRMCGKERGCGEGFAQVWILKGLPDGLPDVLNPMELGAEDRRRRAG